MKTAMLENGNIVRAEQYNGEAHGSRIYCIDTSCKVPVIHVPQSKFAAHFKTTGKGDSQHKRGCGFYEPLECVDAIKKVKEYQDAILNKEGVKETVIRLNMNRIDPDYETRTIELERKSDSDKEEKVKVKDDKENPESVGSVKGIVKLMTSYEPDTLATILFNIGGGRKIPLSSLIVDQKEAHRLLWTGEMLHVGYFVHGVIQSVTRREKVWYINFEVANEESPPFTLVIFEKYFKHFSYKDKELIGKEVLVFGHLRKNDYKNEPKTEMLIKSNKYLEIIS